MPRCNVMLPTSVGWVGWPGFTATTPIMRRSMSSGVLTECSAYPMATGAAPGPAAGRRSRSRPSNSTPCSRPKSSASSILIAPTLTCTLRCRRGATTITTRVCRAPGLSRKRFTRMGNYSATTRAFMAGRFSPKALTSGSTPAWLTATTPSRMMVVRSPRSLCCPCSTFTRSTPRSATSAWVGRQTSATRFQSGASRRTSTEPSTGTCCTRWLTGTSGGWSRRSTASPARAVRTTCSNRCRRDTA